MTLSPVARLAWLEEIQDDHSLPRCAVAVAAVLVRFANGKTGACFPSLKTLAGAARFCLRSVQNGLKALAEAGKIVIEHRRGPRNSWLSNLYHLVLPEAAAAPAESADPMAGNASPMAKAAAVEGGGMATPATKPSQPGKKTAAAAAAPVGGATSAARPLTAAGKEALRRLQSLDACARFGFWARLRTARQALGLASPTLPPPGLADFAALAAEAEELP